MEKQRNGEIGIMMNLIQESLPNGNIAIVEDMVLIPAGSFLMGSESGSEFEKPVHGVYLDAYLIDATPVTNAQFEAFVKATGYCTTAEEREKLEPSEKPSWRTFASSDRKEHPVVCVSWYDAVAFAKNVGKRLPTEAEWEKAARGSLENRLFPWGDEQPAEGRTNWNQVQNGQSAPPTSAVRTYAPNKFGIYDISGNTWEWCEDWYMNEYYASSPDKNPRGPGVGHFRVRRGASWNVREAFRLRCANRGAMPPDSFWPNIGFRCARDL